MPELTDPEMGFGLDHPDQGDVEHEDAALDGDPLDEDDVDVPDVDPDTTDPDKDA